ncbi:protein phosphatase 1 regulatory subunit 14B-like isoform X2 [Ornithodoros turicata]|uniref:protein phosphatase 1 regulatory subunit 14B-like isoform X2 n=1 Tax=Ornithodoros turicata TaxID=34597 RepID=UPI0031386749
MLASSHLPCRLTTVQLAVMECSLPASYCSPTRPPVAPPAGSDLCGPPKGLHVNFDTDKDDPQDRRKKYLTAKYGPHQMSLIKKRLRVEMWMYEQLQVLYRSSDDNHDIEIDLDELLDMESDRHRREFLTAKLADAKQSSDHVQAFITELLQRAKTL